MAGHNRHFGYKYSHFGEDAYGMDVKAFGDTTGKYVFWDASADTLYVVGNLTQTGTLALTGAQTISSTLTVTGLSNLNGGIAVVTDKFTVSAAGAVAAASTLSAKGIVSFGANLTELTISTAGLLVAASRVDAKGGFKGGANLTEFVVGTDGSIAVVSDKFTVSAAGAVVAASTVKSTGDFTVGDSKFVVTAASGNLVSKGSIGAGANGTEFTVSSAGAVVAASTVKSTGDFTVGADKFVVTAASGDLLSKGAIGAGANGTEFTVSSAGAVVAASTVKSTGDFTVGDSKFVVTAATGALLMKAGIGAGTNGTEFTVDASGNTAAGGTLGVTGAATLSGGTVTALYYTDTADGTIPAYRLAEIDASGDLVVGTVDSHTVVGANFENAQKVSTDTIKLAYQKATLVAATPIKGGHLLKCADNGRATHLVTAALAGGTMKTSAAGSDFANQPANDGVTVVSDDAGDTTQTCTIIGTTQGGVTVVAETVTLNGTVDVNTTKVDWGVILAVKLSASCAGTVEVSETSGGLAITTLTTGVLSKGVNAVAAADQGAYNVAPTVQGSDTTTKTVGVKYVTTAAVDGYQGIALTDATPVAFGAAALLVSELYTGDLESTRTCVLKVGAEEDELHRIGYASAAAEAAANFVAVLNK